MNRHDLETVRAIVREEMSKAGIGDEARTGTGPSGKDVGLKSSGPAQSPPELFSLDYNPTKNKQRKKVSAVRVAIVASTVVFVSLAVIMTLAFGMSFWVNFLHFWRGA